jgi:hypothetical protein
MASTYTIKSPRTVGICSAIIAQCFLVHSFAFAQEKLTEPVYRVANETPAAQPAAAAQTPVAAGAPAVAAQTVSRAQLDFTKKKDEHELMPVLRALKASQEEIDRNIRDYSCTFVKRERVNGQLGEYQHILLKVMHQPFSVYMKFIQPFPNREVVYVNGQNNSKMVVLDAGFTRVFGKINLDPNGQRAMDGQKHPITDVGIRNLCAKLAKMWEEEAKFTECTVTTSAGRKVEGRAATLVQVVHPTQRANFKFNYSRVYFDDELKIPIYFDAFAWPQKQGDKPELEECYSYAKNLKANNNLTARDFDSNNNPEIFKK